VDRFTSNEQQSGRRPIVHISSNALHQQKRIIFALKIVSYSTIAKH